MSRLYDPNDHFSLLNPYSAPNVLMKSSAAVYERHRQSVAESASFVERMQGAGRTQGAAVYPRYTADRAPVVAGRTAPQTDPCAKRVIEFWLPLLLAISLFLTIQFCA